MWLCKYGQGGTNVNDVKFGGDCTIYATVTAIPFFMARPQNTTCRSRHAIQHWADPLITFGRKVVRLTETKYGANLIKSVGQVC